ncbi:MAG: Gldg family protein [Myxococcota bacterium]
MRHIWSIAMRELRGYFQSAVAVIFLATFLAVVMFTFFWVDKFFARNIADLRPLFDWLPILLIFLVGALTMRLWSEEHRSGTIEILMTMPVPANRLVLGKFLAGLLLVAIALALTLGLPLSVSMMGDLDWGPVVGGYLAALLLAGAYLSIGLAISSSTENPIVALIGTVLVCGLLYLPGTEVVAGLVGTGAGDVLRGLGSGSRFESVARGVLDLRDLLYYAGIMVLFLTLNVLVLRARRWGHGAATRPLRLNAVVATVLIAANVVVLNLWISPVGSARVDLTDDRAYSLSTATKEVLRSLDEPLVIRGYFSSRTHPLLAPLVPRIRDMLEEYRIAGGGRVEVGFVDPSTDEEVEKEAYEQYGIKSVPLQFADRRETSVVNTHFHVLVSYGDQHEVLGVDDLIAVEVLDLNDVRARLKNLEYDLTRAVRKVVHGFQSLDALFASFPSDVELTAYMTPETLPEDLASGPANVARVARELEEQSGGKLRYAEVIPETQEQQQELYQRYGLQPYRANLLSNEHFYFHIVLRVGEKLVRLPMPEDVSESALSKSIKTALRRAAPGFTKVVGLVLPPEEPPQQLMPNMPPQPVPSLSYTMLRQTLASSYEVKDVDLYGEGDEEQATMHVPDDVDVLLLAGPRDLGEEARLAVDQFLMRGGAVILLAGAYELNLQGRGLSVRRVETGLEPLLEHWGVEIEGAMVADEQNDAFPLPVMRNLGGLQVQEIQRLDYPYFVRVSGEGMEDGGVATSGIGATIAHWASPVSFQTDPESENEIGVDVLMRSSPDSWLHRSTAVQPDFNRFPGEGFETPSDIPEEEQGPHTLAIALTGSFESAVATDGEEEGEEPESSTGGEERLMKRSPDDSRLVVVGSASMLSDPVLGVSERAGSQDVAGNMTLVSNLVDWAVEDTALLSIRARGGPRTLEVDEDSQARWEWMNYGVALLALLAVVMVGRMRRTHRELFRAPAKAGKDDAQTRNKEAA